MELAEPAVSEVARTVESSARGSEGENARAIVPVPQTLDGGTAERHAGNDTSGIQRRQAMPSVRVQQALKAYSSQETFAQQESRTALNKVLGVDYYA